MNPVWLRTENKRDIRVMSRRERDKESNKKDGPDISK